METIDFGANGARITVNAITVPIWRAVEDIFADHRYTIRPSDTGAYNCRQITGGSGYSLHAYGIAVDVNWSTNPYGSTLRTDMPPGAIRAIEALEVDGAQVLRWGGRYSGNKDAMHFEVVVPPSAAVRFNYEGDWLMGAKEDIIDANGRAARAQGQKTRKLIRTLATREAERDRRLSAKEIAEITEAIEAEN